MKRVFLLMATVVLFIAFCICCVSGEKRSDSTVVVENILARKSVRSFTERQVEDEKVDLMLRAGMAAPSARDLRPWELIVVNDRVVLDKLSALPYAKMLAEAPLAIVVCGDVGAQLWEHDCSAVTQNILLAAEALGLGAVWTAAYPYQERIDIVSSTLGLPENIKPLCVIPIGYPKGVFEPKNKWDVSKVHYNKW